jgi:Family of unknown function (DUF6599)
MKSAPFLLLVVLAASFASAQDYLKCQLVPGWEQSGASRQYSGDNLYEYMDGNAEGYLLYGFVHMNGITCKSGADTLVIDVSEMEDSDLAYGMFAANRDPNQPIADIAMGGQIQPQRASFAKGKYYVEIAASPEADHTPALKAFVTKLQEAVEGRSTPPDALSWFAKEDLVSARLIPESVLGLRQLKRGYVAKYAQGQAFIVLEATPEAAAETMKKLRQRFADASSAQIADEAFQAKTQYLDSICIFRKGHFVAGYANLPDAQQAFSMAGKLAARIP